MGGKDISLSYKQIGISELDLSKEGLNQLSIRRVPFNEYQNTPDISKAHDLQIKFNVVIHPSKEFERAKHLIPMMYLVDNIQHEIEGLDKNHDTNKPNLPPHPQPIKLRQTNRIEIEDIVIKIPESVETEIMKSAQQNLMITNASGNQADAANSYKNIEKQGYKLSICYHNNRTTVNKGGIQNKTILTNDSHEEKEIDGKKVIYRILKYNGSAEVDNIFSSKTSMLVFQLEYKVILNTAHNRIDKDFIIGFLLVYISDKFGQKEFILEDTLMVGGSKSIDLKSMMRFQAKLPIYVVAKINLSSAFGGQSPRESFVKEKPSPLKAPKSQTELSLQTTSQIIQKEEYSEPIKQVGNDTILKHTTRLKELEREVEEKQREFEELNNQQSRQKMGGGLNSQSQGAVPNTSHKKGEFGQKILPSSQNIMIKANTREYQEIVSQYEQRVKELQKTITQLKEENETSKQQSQKEFSEIKGMIGTIRRPHTSYNTLKDPFASGRAQNDLSITHDNQKKKEEILEIYNTVPKMRSHFKSYQDFKQKSVSGTEPLSNDDKVYLINKGIRVIIDEDAQVGDEGFIEESDLMNEYKDQFQASEFSLKVIAFKASIRYFEERNQLQKESILSENYNLPEKMFFRFNFFEFEECKTEPYSYQDAGQIQAIKKLLSDNKPIVLETSSYLFNKIGAQQTSYKFNIDPSQFYPEVHKNFVDYLYRKSLHLEIWDADNLMLYGTVKIPLGQLLRKQKQQVEIQKTFPIIDTNYRREKGELIVFLKNKGIKSSVEEISNTQLFNKSGGLQNSHFSQGLNKSQNLNQTGISNINNLQNTIVLRKKIQSIEPLKYDQAKTISHIQQNNQNQYDFSNDPEQRQRERIRRFKIKSLQKEQGQESNIQRFISEQEEEFKKIQNIQVFKDVKKGTYIKNVISSLLTSESVLDVQFGTAKYFTHVVKNNGHDTGTFFIKVDDPDAHYIGFSELNPVISKEEWKYLKETENIQGPQDTEYIEKEKMSFSLQRGDSVTIIFKFLTFREIDLAIDKNTNLEEYLSDQKVQYRQKYINQRVINVSITNSYSQNENCGFKICVRPHRQVIDHVYRFYERCNKQADITFPALYPFKNPKKQKPFLCCTDINVHFSWTGDHEIRSDEELQDEKEIDFDNVINLQIKVPDVLEVTRFHLLAYTNQFQKDLLAIWEVEVNSLEGKDIKIDMGLQKQTNLTLNSTGMSLVKFHSSRPLSVWFEKPFDQPYSVTKGKVNNISLSMRSFTLDRQRVQINCVDQSTKELLYSWMVRIDTEKPVVSKIYDIKIPVNKETHIQKFTFQNRTGKKNNFFIESSQLDLLKIVDPKVSLGISDTAQIRIRIMKQEQPDMQEVFVFITSSDEKMECILFKLYFISNK